MPTLHLHLTPPPTDAHSIHLAQLAQALTDITARLLGKRPEVTAVLVHTQPAAQWFIGGAVPAQPTALLQIDITAGTNTAEEKSAFIAAAWAELERQWGAGQPLAPASYVIVRELVATDWGYGGLTQAARQQARQRGLSAPVPVPAAV